MRQAILGAILIEGIYGNIAGGWGQPFINAGVGLMIGGITQMLAPQPKGLGSQDSVENRPSYSMNGTVNNQAQGNPVPVAYGGHDQKGMMMGSVVISGGIVAEDQL